MTRLYYNIFSISYDSLKIYNSIDDIEKWDEQRKNFNFQINDLIFKFISKKNKNNSSDDQFSLDYINFFLSHHVATRIKYFNNRASKFIFIFFSFISRYILTIRLFMSILKKYVFDYKLDNLTKLKDCTLCIGFPKHSFNYSNQYMETPNSFIEYCLTKNIFDEKENIVSIDEYVRKSYNWRNYKKSNHIDPLSFNRNIVQNSFSLLRLAIFFPLSFYYFFIFIKENKSLSISKFSYYLRNKLISKKYLSLYQRLSKMKISINNIIFLHTHYIYGSIFKGYYQDKIKTFTYSQNYHIPTSKINASWLSKDMNSINLKPEILVKELYTRLFSEFYMNPINFTFHGKFFSKIRGIINDKYKTNLINSRSEEEKNNFYLEENLYSNLGYEKIEILNLDSNKSILFCDNSIESKEHNITRDLFGDIIALEDFMYSFYYEIIYVAKSLNYNLYYKGKYWQDLDKVSVLEKASNSLNYQIHRIDPYSKVCISNDNKFDCILNYPFTSTYYTFNYMTNKNLFYVPTNYIKSFDNNTENLCLGKQQLTNYLKN
jgi:hypothetical protein